MTVQEIRERIQSGLPGSEVEIQDPYNDGVHIKAIVKFSGFAGKSIVEQHRMVYATLKDELKAEVHALGLETKIS
ncbi:BolA/IbaG family iron-sulfur metabolism protein [Leptospira venezuelensis]|uniref:BolA/IbaG family iron-sulfur metabolism protein n=1 Tax=Leptospira venezuelensis TaxID=1958811 RepID=UPI000A38B9ED|nr:BolA/IbaG family iron-sulfur metabolism protein [Leptospira venezuelensis]